MPKTVSATLKGKAKAWTFEANAIGAVVKAVKSLALRTTSLNVGHLCECQLR